MSLSHPLPFPGLVRNRLLRALPPPELEQLWPQMERVSLAVRSIIMKAEAPVETVYFMEEGTVSMIKPLLDGAQIEVGIVGFEGMIGLPVLFGAPTSLMETVVQVEGCALRLSSAAFRAALHELPGLMPVMLRYVDSVQSSLAQSAACNARHQIDQRLARWILMMHDRIGGDSFRIRQEFMSIMLGVRRPGVTLALGALQRAGLVIHSKGVMQVLDRRGLETACCECYRAVQHRFEWLEEQK